MVSMTQMRIAISASLCRIAPKLAMGFTEGRPLFGVKQGFAKRRLSCADGHSAKLCTAGV
jgi:hypothetical protein